MPFLNNIYALPQVPLLKRATVYAAFLSCLHPSEALAWEIPSVEKLNVYFSDNYFKILIGSQLFFENSLGR